MAILNERIKERRTACNFTLLEIADKLGVKEATVQRYESGQIKNIRHETILELSNIFGCSPAYLMGWIDTPFESQTASKSSANKSASMVRIPLSGQIAAGQPIWADENIEEWLTVDERNKVDFALRVKGDSMNAAGIYDGDIIYVRKQPTVNNGEIAVVLIDDGHADSSEATCKRFYQYGKTVVLRPESHSPEYKEREIVLGKGINVHVQGKVIFIKGYVEGR